MYEFDNIVKFSTLVVGIAGLLKVLFEYTKAQKWKRAEFLAKEMKDFFADSNVKRALLMLDWEVIYVPIYEKEITERVVFLFEDKMIIKALDCSVEATFDEEQTVIRQVIDDFLFKLGMFQNYIDSKLISKKDVEPYLMYWVLLIAGVGKSKKNRRSFKSDMEVY